MHVYSKTKSSLVNYKLENSALIALMIEQFNFESKKLYLKIRKKNNLKFYL